MLLPAELAHCDDGIDMLKLALQEPGPAPELQGPPVTQVQRNSSPAGAQLPPMPPEDMHWADQPVLVGHVELKCLAVLEYTRPSDQRDIVKVDDVILAFRQNPPDPATVYDGSPGLLGQ